jgi:hypothetical protein
MTDRDYIKTQIDILPDTELKKLIEFIAFRKYSLGIYNNDTEYLASIPGMVESIKVAASEPLENGVSASEVDFNV